MNKIQITDDTIEGIIEFKNVGSEPEIYEITNGDFYAPLIHEINNGNLHYMELPEYNDSMFYVCSTKYLNTIKYHMDMGVVGGPMGMIVISCNITGDIAGLPTTITSMGICPNEFNVKDDQYIASLYHEYGHIQEDHKHSLTIMTIDTMKIHETEADSYIPTKYIEAYLEVLNRAVRSLEAYSYSNRNIDLEVIEYRILKLKERLAYPNTGISEGALVTLSSKK